MSSQATSHSPPATDSDEVLVRVQGVSKKFCRSLKRSLWYGLCDIGGELNPFRRQVAEVAGSGLLLAGNGSKSYSSELATSNSPLVTPAAAARDEDLRDGEFYAVRDVSFELRRGECLGLIGHNGAGKTTLLKILNGLIKPDRGRIEMNGRVGALIALGSGFNPILTGRENIYIYGSVLGINQREIDKIIDEIIDFAEVREFIDMPVQSFSSGMAVRLGFAVASSLRPDILLLDEVLAVGDTGFVIKCLNRLRDLTADAAVILVSHNMQSISGFCSRVIMLEKGCQVMDTFNVTAAISRHYDSVEIHASEEGTGEVKLLSCEIVGAKEPAENKGGKGGDQAIKRINIHFEVSSRVTGTECQLNVTDSSGIAIVGVPVLEALDRKRIFTPGLHRITITFDSADLNSGKYYCTLVFRDPRNLKIYNRTQGVAAFRMFDEKCYGPRIVKPVVIGH